MKLDQRRPNHANGYLSLVSDTFSSPFPPFAKQENIREASIGYKLLEVHKMMQY